MSHYHLSNVDSTIIYLEDCYDYYSKNIEKKISILPYLIDSYLQIGNKIKAEELATALLEKEVIFKEDLETIFGQRKWKSYEEEKLNEISSKA